MPSVTSAQPPGSASRTLGRRDHDPHHIQVHASARGPRLACSLLETL